MQRVRQFISRVAPIDATVLIEGESGTGKELVARAIHEASPRRNGRFVAIACGAIPRDLVESELFGHEKGAFSSAAFRRVGKFELASGGTLFLDDLPTLPLETQAKLLRALAEREICRVGSNQLIPVDVRLVASTNQDLEAQVKAGAFREDLYHRVQGVPLLMPPLRERDGDVDELLELFMARACQRHKLPRPRIHPQVQSALRSYPFPGNVRQLMNLAETLVVLAQGGEVQPADLPPAILRYAAPADSVSEAAPEVGQLKAAVHEFERRYLIKALEQAGNNQSKAARNLGIHRNTLLLKLQELGIKQG
jgi:DNA-binding NtrC family response regulator